jgi:hypothetical protein
VFDLFKDIETYKGITPYASEHYGVYQPLLGWESNLTKKWIQRGSILIDPRVKLILDGRLQPGKSQLHLEPPLIPVFFSPASLISPFKVMLAKNLNSEILKLLQAQVQNFVDANNGRLPKDDEWKQQIIEVFMDAKNDPLRKVYDIHRNQLLADILTGNPSAPEMTGTLETTLLGLMQYESQIATFLIILAEGLGGEAPNELQKLFFVRKHHR